MIPTQSRSAKGTSQPSFRKDIQGIRALAIASVLAFHFGLPWCSGGFVGVDIFFVLSGYLITGLLYEELRTNGRIDYARFYSRRAKRLLPASAVMLLGVIAISTFVYSPLEQERVAQTGLATALYVSNMYFAHAAQNYFAPQSAVNPLLHTWSLGVEEQFYFGWPLLLALLYQLADSRRKVVYFVSCVGALSLVLCVLYTQQNQSWAFFLVPMRMWEFGLGAVAVICRWGKRIQHLTIVGWCGLLGILASVAFIKETEPFPGPMALLPAVSTMLLLVGGEQHNDAPFWSTTRLLSLRPFEIIGNLSYSLYLWHWPVLVLAAAYAPTSRTASRCVILLAVVGCALVSFYLVEQPIRCSTWKAQQTWRLLATSVTCTLALAVMFNIWRLAVTHNPQYVAYKSAQSEIPALFAKNCDVAYREHRVKLCIAGDAHAENTVVLFGDSHAAEWYPALDLIAAKQHWKLITLVKSSCPPTGVAVYRRTPEWGTECNLWRTEALARIRELRPTVVMIGTYTGYGSPEGSEASIAYSTWLASWQDTLRQIDLRYSDVLLFIDSPEPGFSAVDCLARSVWRKAPLCPLMHPQTAIHGDAEKAEVEAAHEIPGAMTVNLNSLMCDADDCWLTKAGLPVYRDSNHLSVAFVTSISSELASQIVPIVRASSQNGRTKSHTSP